MRKHQAIDLLDLYANHTNLEWNRFLSLCLNASDVTKLMTTRYSLQAGMTDVSNKKLNSDKVISFYIRLQRSIEITIDKIYRKKDPNPCDNPKIANEHLDKRQKKRDRDNKIRQLLKKEGY